MIASCCERRLLCIPTEPPTHRLAPERALGLEEPLPGRLNGKVALITGSSVGLGRSMASAFIAEGGRVVTHSRDLARAQAAVSDLGAGDRAMAVAGDLNDVTTAPCDLVANAIAHFGQLDILVNNAGVTTIQPTIDLTLDDWQQIIHVDLTAAFACSQEAAKHFIERGGGSILNISSMMGCGGFPNRAAYTSAKHGLIGMTKALAAEWGQHQIRVNALAPAYIRGSMDDATMATGDYGPGEIERRTPLGRKGEPAEVAAAAVFLVSDDASYISGVNLPVDGGWLAYGGWGDASAPSVPTSTE